MSQVTPCTCLWYTLAGKAQAFQIHVGAPPLWTTSQETSVFSFQASSIHSIWVCHLPRAKLLLSKY